MESLAEMVRKAREAGACEKALRQIKGYKKDIEALNKDKNAPFWAYWYARNVVKGRFEAGEDAIARDAHRSYSYANRVLNGRFEAGEPVIATDSYWACYYAIVVLKGRFEAGEDAIATDYRVSEIYNRVILSK